MLKPVEIEFLMKDNLTPGLDRAGQSAESLSVRAKAAADAINVKIAEQQKNIESVSAKLSQMESQLVGMKPGTAKHDLTEKGRAGGKGMEEEGAE